MPSELLQIYRQLQTMPNTPEVRQLRQDVSHTLRTRQREYFLSFLAIGDAIGYDDLQREFEKALDLLQKINSK